MTHLSARRDAQTVIAAMSLVIGPLTMSVGDLLHPKEKLDAADQVAIIVEHASRWYGAHLLLFIGMILFIPGLFALTQLAVDRRPMTGFIARALIFIGVAAVTSVFVGEMLVARFIQDGGDPAAATKYLEVAQSGAVASALVPALLSFFVGVGLFTLVVAPRPGPLRLPSVVLAIGALFILGEIVSAQVVLSMIGNILIFLASAWIAWLLIRGEVDVRSERRSPAVPAGT